MHETSDPKIVVLGSTGSIRNQESADATEMLNLLGQNSGNLVFQYAANQLFADDVVNIARSELPYSVFGNLKNVVALIFPAANHIRLGADWTSLGGFLRRSRAPVIVLGLGAQAPHLNGQMDIVEPMRADIPLMGLIEALKDKASFISVRGAYTEKVCKELGLENIEVLGCPSALINVNPTLGETLEAQIKNLANNSQAHVGIAAAAPFEIHEDSHKLAIEQKLISFLMENDGAYFQQSGGELVYQLCTGESERIPEDQRRSVHKILSPTTAFEEFWPQFIDRAKLFIDIDDWLLAARKVDLVMGTRIHGCMAAIAANRPGILIAHDSRTDELGATMRLPSLAAEDLLNARSLSEAIDAVAFDGIAFDEWRAKTAARYIEVLKRFDLVPSKNLFKIAGTSNA